MSNNRNRSRSGRPRTAQAASLQVLHLPAEDDVEDQFAQREPLFTIGDTEYTTLVRVSAGAAIEYLERSIDRGPDAAILWGMRHALGDEGVDALYGYRHLTPDHLAQVVDIVRAKFDGALTDPKGRRSNA